MAIERDVPKIDLNRGLLKRIHAATGVAVHMYYDDPGVFLSAHGTPVSEALAAEAGFDVQFLGKLKRKKEMYEVARQQIDAQLLLEAQSTEQHPIIATRADFSVRDMGLGRFQVIDSDGEVLHKMLLTREQALSLLEGLAPNGETKFEGEPEPQNVQ